MTHHTQGHLIHPYPPAPRVRGLGFGLEEEGRAIRRGGVGRGEEGGKRGVWD